MGEDVVVGIHLLEIFSPEIDRIDKPVGLLGFQGARVEVIVKRRSDPFLGRTVEAHMPVSPCVFRHRVKLHMISLEGGIFIVDHDMTVGEIGLRGLVEPHVLGVNGRGWTQAFGGCLGRRLVGRHACRKRQQCHDQQQRFPPSPHKSGRKLTHRPTHQQGESLLVVEYRSHTCCIPAIESRKLAARFIHPGQRLTRKKPNPPDFAVLHNRARTLLLTTPGSRDE